MEILRWGGADCLQLDAGHIQERGLAPRLDGHKFLVSSGTKHEFLVAYTLHVPEWSWMRDMCWYLYKGVGMRYAAGISKNDICLLYKNTAQILSLAHGSRDGRIYLHATYSATVFFVHVITAIWLDALPTRIFLGVSTCESIHICVSVNRARTLCSIGSWLILSDGINQHSYLCSLWMPLMSTLHTQMSYDGCFPTAIGVEEKCFRGEGGVQTDFHCGASQWSFGSTEDFFHWSTVLSVDGSLVGKSWWLMVACYSPTPSNFPFRTRDFLEVNH